MEVGIVGLGRMGGNMAIRLARAGHRVVGNARSPDAIAAVVKEGAVGAATLEDLVQKLAPPRAVWLMIPAGAPTEEYMGRLLQLLSKGDTLIDGGNSHYTDSIRHFTTAQAVGIDFLDIGVSGGIWGLQEGYSMMIGGPAGPVERLRPIFESLAPAPTEGWGHVGGPGAGHFVKMVHNGIEYGMMEAYGEGFDVLRAKQEYGFDLGKIATIWRRGSVVRSWLLDLTAEILLENPTLDKIPGYVRDSGEGRWTVEESFSLGVPTPVITLALEQRIRSRDETLFNEKLLAAMRQKFGGHALGPE